MDIRKHDQILTAIFMIFVLKGKVETFIYRRIRTLKLYIEHSIPFRFIQ